MKGSVLVAIGVILLAVGVGTFINGVGNSEEVTYRGEIVFQEEAEYKAFKALVLSPEVEIIEMNVLSSEPPIWVGYELKIDREFNFPYQYEHKNSNIESGAFWSGFFLCSAGGYCIGTGLAKMSNKE